jgi:hypothetical protein
VYAVLSALLLLLNEIHVKSCSRKKYVHVVVPSAHQFLGIEPAPP